jgi:hypothetical protein
MKDRRYRTSLVVATFLAFTVAAVPGAFARKGCSNASVKGSYGFRFNGTILGGPFAGPATLVGIAKFDVRETGQEPKSPTSTGIRCPRRQSQEPTASMRIALDQPPTSSGTHRFSCWLAMVKRSSPKERRNRYGFNCYIAMITLKKQFSDGGGD